MTSHAGSTTSIQAAAGRVFVAIEVSKHDWLIAGHTPCDGRTSRHKCRGGDVQALLRVIDRLRQREARSARRPVGVICVHEAGYEGFWLHRQLVAAGIESHVIDATSLQVDRRARRAKTDAIDVDGLLRALIAYAGGERGRCRMVRVPTVAEEDAKRTHRERKRLVKERTGHINRIKALLALHGITDYEPIKAGRRQRLHALVTHDGEPLPPRLRRELSRELDRLELVLEQLAEVEAERDVIVPDQAACDQAIAMIAQLMRLRGVGPETGDHPGAGGVLPGLCQPQGRRELCRADAEPLHERHPATRSGNQQGRQPPGADSDDRAGVAVAAPSAGQRAQPLVLRPRRQHQGAAAPDRRRRPCAQTARRPVALRHHRPHPDRGDHEAGLKQENTFSGARPKGP
jgi:transposase